MLMVRSILFNLAFYANLILQMVVLTPIYFLLPRKKAFAIPKNWARSNHWLMEKIVGTTFEIEGLENIPEGGLHLCTEAPILLGYLRSPALAEGPGLYSKA